MNDDTMKPKKPFYKKWWVWLLGIIFILIIASSGGADNSSSSENSDGSSANQEATTETNFSLKQEAAAGDLLFTANSVTKEETVGSGYFAKSSQSGTYLIVNVTVKNNGSDTVTIDSALFKLTDDNGREFTSSSDGQSAIMLSGADDFFLQQVQPGLSMTGDVVFEIPADAAGLQLIAKAGIFSGKKVTIDLE